MSLPSNILSLLFFFSKKLIQKIVKPNERKKRQAGTARATSTLSGTASEPSISITSPSAVDTERTTAASREIPMDPDLDTSTKTVATTKDIEAAEKDYNDYNSYDNEYVETDYVEAETDYNDYNSNGTDNAKTDYSNNNNSGTEDAETDYSDDNSNDNGNYNDNTDYETDYWGNYDGYGGYGESDYEDDTYEEYYDFSDL